MKLKASDLRKELIQTAAVCVAIVRDMDYGTTAINSGKDLVDEGEVYADIARERVHQHRKWGNQTHNPVEWMIILMEEFGEAAGEALKMVDTFYEEENTRVVRSTDARMVLAYASSMEARARKWLQANDWTDPQHKDIHETEAESDA